jgi:hypothetical protein
MTRAQRITHLYDFNLTLRGWAFSDNAAARSKVERAKQLIAALPAELQPEAKEHIHDIERTLAQKDNLK